MKNFKINVLKKSGKRKGRLHIWSDEEFQQHDGNYKNNEMENLELVSIRNEVIW